MRPHSIAVRGRPLSWLKSCSFIILDYSRRLMEFYQSASQVWREIMRESGKLFPLFYVYFHFFIFLHVRRKTKALISIPDLTLSITFFQHQLGCWDNLSQYSGSERLFIKPVVEGSFTPFGLLLRSALGASIADHDVLGVYKAFLCPILSQCKSPNQTR